MLRVSPASNQSYDAQNHRQHAVQRAIIDVPSLLKVRLFECSPRRSFLDAGSSFCWTGSPGASRWARPSSRRRRGYYGDCGFNIAGQRWPELVVDDSSLIVPLAARQRTTGALQLVRLASGTLRLSSARRRGTSALPTC